MQFSKMGMLMQKEHLHPAVLVSKSTLWTDTRRQNLHGSPSGSLRNVGMLVERKHFHPTAVLVRGLSLEWYDC